MVSHVGNLVSISSVLSIDIYIIYNLYYTLVGGMTGWLVGIEKQSFPCSTREDLITYPLFGGRVPQMSDGRYASYRFKLSNHNPD